MGRFSTLNVSLTQHQREFVDARVTSGGYESASEVIRESLRLLEEQERTRSAYRAGVRAKALEGLAEAERGELLDGEVFMADLEQRARQETRRRTGKRQSR